MIYRTINGDVLDAICFRYYEREETIHQVLDANPGLAEYDAVLPAGILITLPDLEIEKETVQSSISLWD